MTAKTPRRKRPTFYASTSEGDAYQFTATNWQRFLAAIAAGNDGIVMSIYASEKFKLASLDAYAITADDAADLLRDAIIYEASGFSRGES